MALRKIIVVGDELLAKKSREVEPTDERTKELIDDLWDTCTAYDGAGLAAVQVGLLRRVAVVTDGEQEITLINPKIIKREGEQKEVEGCLSVPEVSGYVKRPKRVTVETYDTDGALHTYKAENLLARAICHEIDHMDGIVFTSIMEEE